MFRSEPILKSVSRSFYLSVQILPKKIRPVIGLGYLLCRAADTMADTTALPYGERLRMLNHFRDVLEQFPPSEPKLIAFADEVNRMLTAEQSPSEKALMRHLKEIVHLFHGLSRTDQAHIQHVVRAVIDGMSIDLETFPEPGQPPRALPTNADLERYLVLIGGEPGRFWSNVLRGLRPDLKAKWNETWEEHGVQFGTGLQLVNILRDFPRDLTESRCYIPLERLKHYGLTLENISDGANEETVLTLYHDLIADAAARLRSALDYLNRIPANEWRLRAAVWWPCVLGIKTLQRLSQKQTVMETKESTKISRATVYTAMAASGPILMSNRWMKWVFEREAEKISA